jgi:small subunit ribosomal protein S2
MADHSNRQQQQQADDSYEEDGINMKQLLEAGVHFGHQTRRWNPKMAKYIFNERNGIYILDLKKTVRMIHEACEFVKELASRGGKILFVGTKRQAQDSVAEISSNISCYFVTHRWLGGMLTNFRTIRGRVNRLIELDRMREDGSLSNLIKKEQIALMKVRERLHKYLAGIREMNRLPDALFITDVRKERIAVEEANKLGIPVIAIVDTNCDPDPVDYVIPANDDAIRAVRLISELIANAYIQGQKLAVERAEGVEQEEDLLPGQSTAPIDIPIPAAYEEFQVDQEEAQ